MERVEEYLEAIYDIQKKDKKVARTNRIAEALGIKPGSVTEMLVKMSKEGYVDYQPYYGAILTQKGMELARKIKRSHRIFERFLVDFLGVDSPIAHKLACDMEHYIPKEVEDRLCELMSNPEYCEEGKRMDGLECCEVSVSFHPLWDLEVDERGVIVAIRQEDKLKNLGLDCGVEFSVIDKSGDTIIISFSGNELSLSKEVAGLILVKKSQDEFSE